jgi:putative peptidoglycan lipid II flippase
MLYNLKRNKVSLSLFVFNKNRFRKPTNKFLKLLVPAILGNGVYQLNLLIDMILASTLAHGSISFLYYADRVNQLPLGVLGIAISTALLPILSKYVKKNDNVKVTKSISSALKYGLLFSLPAFLGIFILSDEIVTLLFYRGQFDLFDVEQTSAALVALSFGLPAFIMIKILVIPFFAREDTITPIKVSLFSISINLILNLLLIDEFKHVGLAISTSVAAWVNMIILISLLIREKIKFEKDIITFTIKIIISTVIMGISIKLISNIFEQNLINIGFFEIKNVRLIFVIFFAILTYFVSIYLLGIKDISLKKWSKK